MTQAVFINLDDKWSLGLDHDGYLMVSYHHERLPTNHKKQKACWAVSRVMGGIHNHPDRDAIFESAERVVRHEMHERFGIEIDAGPDWASLNLIGY